MKLVAIDLDGTLLSSNLSISEENHTAIREAQNEGNIIMICSGRAPESIRELLDEYDLACPFAASNGTVVVIEGEKPKYISMNKQNMLEVAEILESYGVPYKLYTNDGIWMPEDWSAKVRSALQSNPELAKCLLESEYKQFIEQPKRTDNNRYFRHIQDVINRGDLSVQKFFILQFNQHTRKEIMEQLENIAGIAVTTSGDYNIEIMDEKGNKGYGLKAVAKHYNIPLEQTIAIGDNFNDVPMLEAAGLSVAMGNAEPEVKEMCDIVTRTNDEHGVAHAIRQFVL
ncbi:Cof-type HAD-IIB family hydrolase [Aeribacillus composti]|uniref:Cof-type HAD-IIB family hydrolase n=1 Tax=Aeribacillus composti TaxID=1868734 RepID=UPI003D237FA1